jgi:hypothetical protein
MNSKKQKKKNLSLEVKQKAVMHTQVDCVPFLRSRLRANFQEAFTRNSSHGYINHLAKKTKKQFEILKVRALGEIGAQRLPCQLQHIQVLSPFCSWISLNR